MGGALKGYLAVLNIAKYHFSYSRVHPCVIEALLRSKFNEPVATFRSKIGTLVENRRLFAQRFNLGKTEGLFRVEL